MLAKLTLEKLKSEGISIRAAAREMGIAHTTLNRVLAGKDVDLSTLEQISQWLGVEISTVLNSYKKDDLPGQIATLIQMEPELARVFGEAMEGVLNGKYSKSDIQDIVAYAAFRLKIKDR